MPMPENLAFFTFPQLQQRWARRYRRVLRILVAEEIPVLCLSETKTFRIPVEAIVQLEKRRENLIPRPIA